MALVTDCLLSRKNQQIAYKIKIQCIDFNRMLTSVDNTAHIVKFCFQLQLIINGVCNYAIMYTIVLVSFILIYDIHSYEASY